MTRVLFTCPKCHLQIPMAESDWPLACACGERYDKPEQDLPPIAVRLWNYAEAVKRWQERGRPVRAPEEINRIFQICQGCELFHNGTCRKCGCAVNQKKNALRNKIRMASENCPIRKW